ncbi:MAG: hypothetical protein QXS89_06185 [Sulfolobales archaeon]
MKLASEGENVIVILTVLEVLGFMIRLLGHLSAVVLLMVFIVVSKLGLSISVML